MFLAKLSHIAETSILLSSTFHWTVGVTAKAAKIAVLEFDHEVKSITLEL
jgi:hypothetical protein